MQHKRQSSDFGYFVSAREASGSTPRRAATASTSRNTSTALETGDLLGSFDDITESGGAQYVEPVLEPDEVKREARHMAIQLPPRPDEMPADYVPPIRSPRRMSQPYISSGPQSPPAISTAGHDIIFHTGSTGNHPSYRKWVSASDHNGRTPSSTGPDNRHDPTQPLGAVTTTGRAAAKWRRATDQPVVPSNHLVLDMNNWPDVTHDNPFITPEQLAGSYIPPSGAPGFHLEKANPPLQHTPASTEESDLDLRGRRPTTTPVLDQTTAHLLRRYLPVRQRLSRSWSLVFSLDQHGASLATLYRQSEAATRRGAGFGSLLIIEDGHGDRFGAFMNEPIIRKEGSFYGSGESFLFKANGNSPTLYRWTGKNQYFALCETSLLSFGAGSGTYGLALDSTFSKNSSATCPTFDNEILCENLARHSEKSAYFDCVGLEVWATTAL